jgi:hypothetical protein
MEGVKFKEKFKEWEERVTHFVDTTNSDSLLWRSVFKPRADSVKLSISASTLKHEVCC